MTAYIDSIIQCFYLLSSLYYNNFYTYRHGLNGFHAVFVSMIKLNSIFLRDKMIKYYILLYYLYIRADRVMYVPIDCRFVR